MTMVSVDPGVLAPEPKIPTLNIPVGSKENIQSKALRILLERRLTIQLVQGDRVIAECRGTDAVYHLGFVNGAWWCHCEARGDKCSHLRALQHVVVRPKGQ